MRRFISFISLILITIKSLAKIIIHSKFRTEIPKLRANSNSKLIVLGNGPSLNQTIEKYKDILQRNDLLCVNAFSLSTVYADLQPKYYIIADPQFWRKNPIPGMDDFCSSVINAIVSKTNWDLILFTPFESAKFPLINELGKNPHIRLVFYNKTSISGFACFRNFFFKKNIGIPRAQNVLIPSIMMGLNLGYSEIYVTGADHSWHEGLVIDDDNQLCIRDEHFYDREKTNLRPIKDIITGRNIHLNEQLKALALVFELYFVIEEYARTQNARVYNSSEKSFIDAFKRNSLATLK